MRELIFPCYENSKQLNLTEETNTKKNKKGEERNERAAINGI